MTVDALPVLEGVPIIDAADFLAPVSAYHYYYGPIVVLVIRKHTSRVL